MEKPIVCLSEQLSSFLPTKSLVRRIDAAKSLASRVGGKTILFIWDSWHRGTAETVLPGNRRISFEYYNNLQRDYTPFYLKNLDPVWWNRAKSKLDGIVPGKIINVLDNIKEDTAGNFCLKAYKKLGFLDNLEVVRSSDPEIRKKAKMFEDFYVEVSYKGEIVRARYTNRGFVLESNPPVEIYKTDVVPGMVTPPDEKRFEWMDSIVSPSHYILGEKERVKESDFPWISFVRSRKTEQSDTACWPSWRSGYVQVKTET